MLLSSDDRCLAGLCCRRFDGVLGGGLVAVLAVLKALVLIDELGLPLAQIVLGVIEDLAGLAAVGVRLAGVAGDNGRVVEQLQQALAVAGQDDLLLSTLDGGGKLGLVRLLELLAGLLLVSMLAANS